MAFQGFLKQSTAVDVLIGPFVDSTDGNSEEVGLTISQSDVQLSKNGGGLSPKNDSDSCAHSANGCYICNLNATDTNTVGQLTLYVHEGGALPVRLDYHVVEEVVHVAMYGAAAVGPATASALTTHHTLLNTVDSNAEAVAVAWANGGRLDLIIDQVLADTNELQTNQGNWLTATGFATPTNVTDAHATTDGKIDTVDGNVDAILLDTGTDGVVGVTGNVNGKVLGGGATAITGLGVHAQDYQGNPIATASDLNTVKSHTIDWTDGGRLDLLLDQVLEDTGTTLPASIAAVQTDLDTITDDGVKLADGVTHGGTTALLSLKTIAVAATGADVDAVTITSAAGHDFAFTANKDVIHVTSCVDFIEIDACQQIIAAVACTGTGIQITTTGARAMYIQSTHASGIAAHYSGTSKGVAMSGQDSNGLAVDSFSGSAIGLASGVTNDIDGVLATVADVTTKTGYALATTGLDTALIDGVVASTYFAYMGATLTGKLSGVSANSPVFKAPDGSTTRVAATTSADGRTTVTLTPPA